MMIKKVMAYWFFLAVSFFASSTQAALFGYHEEKDQKGDFSFVIEADAINLNEKPIYPIPADVDSLSAVEKAVAEYYQCIVNNPDNQPLCFTKGNKAYHSFEDINHFASKIKMVTIESILKLGQLVSVPTKYMRSGKDRPSYDSIYLSCQHDECYPLLGVDNYRLRGYSLDLHNLILDIDTAFLYQANPLQKSSFNPRDYTTFKLLSEDSGASAFIDLQPANGGDVEQLLNSLANSCPLNDCTNGLLAIDKNANKRVQPLAIINADNSVAVSGYLSFDQYEDWIKTIKSCELFASLTARGIKRGYFYCTGNGEYNYITMHPLLEEGFDGRFRLQPFDGIMASRAAASVLNEVRLGAKLPYTQTKVVSEKPGYNIADGKPVKVQPNPEVMIPIEQPTEPSNSKIITAAIIMLVIALLIIILRRKIRRQ